MDAIIWLVVIATSIWVAVDASSIGVKKGMVKGLGNMGPAGWFFACLLLWIIAFPLYLAKRGEFKRLVAGPSTSTSQLDQLEQLGRLKNQGLLTDEEFQAKKLQLLG